MADRDTLIAQKHAVRRALEHAQRELERLRSHTPPSQRHVAQLESQVERLMAEEFNLRLAIDRAR